MHIISRSLLIMLIFFGASTAGGTDLAEVYQIALASDPTLREANANRLASSEASPQARAALLPLITGFYSRGNGDSSGSSTFQQVDTNGVTQNVINSFKSDTNRIEQWSLDLRQPLFRWDRIVGLRQAQKTVAQAEIDYQAAQQNLMLRVAEAYFNVLAAQDTLDAEVIFVIDVLESDRVRSDEMISSWFCSCIFILVGQSDPPRRGIERP